MSSPPVQRPRTSRLVVGAMVAVVIVVIAAAAWQLARSQSDSRDALRDRFASRAPIATGVIDALFRTAFAPQSTSLPKGPLGRPAVTTASIDAVLKTGTALFGVVLDGSGHVLAASSKAPASLRADGLTTYDRDALHTGYGLSDAIDGTPPFVATAIRFTAGDGPRLYVTGSPLAVYSGFLGGTLKPVAPQSGGGAFVLDGNGRTLATLGPDPQLATLLAKRPRDETSVTFDAGEIGKQFSAAAPIGSSRWRVFIAADNSVLLKPSEGIGRWLPWVILGLFAVALAAAVLLLGRVLSTGAQLAGANTQLAGANDELRRSNAELEQFAYVASHDLSSPLRSVAGFSQLLSTRYAGKLDDEADRFIGFMQEGVDRMQRIIDDLLSYSRIDQRELDSAPVELEGVLAELERSLEPMIAEKHAVVTHDPLPVVSGERGQIAQVLQNLMVNGMTYVAAGVTPAIHVGAVRTGPLWRITVTDNGMGIEPEHAERIFKMFQRLHRREDFPGTGIGLAISRKMVERHGGTLVVEPSPSGGSTFAFTLPATGPTAPKAPTR